MSIPYFDLFDHGQQKPTITTGTTLTKRTKSDPKVYRRYKFIDKGVNLSHDDCIDILMRKNGKVAQYTHKGSHSSVSGVIIKYDKDTLIETTLEHCIENINTNSSTFKWLNLVTINALAKEANIHPYVLIEIIQTYFNNTRIYKLMMDGKE